MDARDDSSVAELMAVVISPVLIMALVGSLVFFLLEVFYQGQYEARLRLVMALFVVAAVLIGRISIETGYDRAAPYAVALAAAVLLAANRFIEYQAAPLVGYSTLVNLLIIGVVWFSSHRLTWDCTLVDDSEEAGGEGLLLALGLDWPFRRRDDRGATAADGTAAGEPAPPPAVIAPGAKPRRRTPGATVVFFSLAALPLFGLGQLLIPADDAVRRQHVFFLLCAYVASGMGLLLTTSFLRLRRYLRRRKLVMPAGMAGVWLASGGGLVAVIMFVAMLLPRPNAEIALSQVPVPVVSADQRASRYGTGREGAEADRDDARRVPGEAPEEAESVPGPGREGEDEASGGTAHDEEGDEGAAADAEASGRAGAADGDEGAGDSEADNGEGTASPAAEAGEQAPGGDRRPTGEGDRSDGPAEETAEASASETRSPQASAPTEQSSPRQPSSWRLPELSVGGWLAALLKWAFYAALLAAAVYGVIRCREPIRAALTEWLSTLRSLWARLFGGAAAATGGVAGEPSETDSAPRPFADFPDPFRSGLARAVPPAEVVRYSFQALEAWARERGCARLPEQTPLEFARQVTARHRRLGAPLRTLADLYSRAAYAADPLSAEAVEGLRPLWQRLAAGEPIAAAPGARNR